MVMTRGRNDSTEDRSDPTGDARVVDVMGLGKTFDQNGQTLTALDGVDFHADQGEFVSIIGPSGCGKSTLLNIIAGLDEPSYGDLKLRDTRIAARLGNVGYMQQKDLLMPWRSVLDNAILGLEIRGVPRGQARDRASALMGQFGLEGFESEYPSALSGGMRQRAAFLRTVLADQQMFLLDEPFGALDALNRARIHEWLLELWDRLNKTIIMVTHDVDEAIFLSDRVYVMSRRPGAMTVVADVDLPRPRSSEMVTSDAFVGLKARLLSAIRRETEG